MNTTASFKAKCPFYENHTPLSITCEWIGGRSLCTRYPTKEQVQRDMDAKCCDRFEKCIFYQLHMKKYEVEKRNGE